MNSIVIKNELQLSHWAVLIKECQTSGMKKSDWSQTKGITKDQYYYWRRKVRDHALGAVNASFVEIMFQMCRGFVCYRYNPFLVALPMYDNAG